MTIPRKQLKITKLFKKGTTKLPDDCDELQEEVRQLEQRLREKQNELFQIQRNRYRKKASPPKKKEDSFVRPQRIILNNSIESLKRKVELISMLSSTEVQSYVAEEYCCVVFHMQHTSDHVVDHGIRIDLTSGRNEISAKSLPVGFNLSGVMEDFDNVMKPECLGAIRKALVAYYDRLEQFQRLKDLVNIRAELFKTLDGSHVQISLIVKDDEEQYALTLMLDYRVYDIRPKNYSVKEDTDLPEGASDVIREQCAIFKKQPLHRAFQKAFLSGDGQYELMHQMPPLAGELPPPHAHHHHHHRRHHHHHNDDTFRPDDCSDQGDDDDDLDDVE